MASAVRRAAYGAYIQHRKCRLQKSRRNLAEKETLGYADVVCYEG
jgi:hypothetical protein